MTDRLHDALQVCLLAMETGADLQACLSLYPDLQGELRPALEAASLARMAMVQSLPAPAQMRSRTKVLARTAQLGKRRPWLLGVPSVPRFALASLMVILVTSLGWGGLNAASAASLPGDALYGVKRWGENLRLNLALNGGLKDDLVEGYRERRVDEVRRLLDLGRTGTVAFEGQLRRQSDALWFVAEIPVALDSGTRIVGSMEDGVIVEVQGITESGNREVRADQVVLRFLQFVGDVEEMKPEAWTIRGAMIRIESATQIDPGITLNGLVLVRARVRQDGGLVAETILRLPEPTPTSKTVEPPAPIATELPAVTPHEQRLDDMEFQGIVEAMGSETWIIDGRPVKITQETEIDHEISIGHAVKVEAFVDLGGALTARKIERSEDTSREADDDAGDDIPEDGREGDGSGGGDAGSGRDSGGGEEDGVDDGDATPGP